MNQINRLSSLRLSKNKAKFLSLHPPSIENDFTMAQYLHRVSTEVPEPPTRVHVTMSGDDIVKGVSVSDATNSLYAIFANDDTRI